MQLAKRMHNGVSVRLPGASGICGGDVKGKKKEE